MAKHPPIPPRNRNPHDTELHPKDTGRPQSRVSGGGGERDKHHSHDPVAKGGGSREPDGGAD